MLVMIAGMVVVPSMTLGKCVIWVSCRLFKDSGSPSIVPSQAPDNSVSHVFPSGPSLWVRTLPANSENKNMPAQASEVIFRRGPALMSFCQSTNLGACSPAQVSSASFVEDVLDRGSRLDLEKICSALGWSWLIRAFRTYVDRSRSVLHLQTRIHGVVVESSWRSYLASLGPSTIFREILAAKSHSSRHMLVTRNSQ